MVGFGSLGGVGRAAMGTRAGQGLLGSKLGQTVTRQGTRFTPKNTNFLINQEGFVAPSIKQVNPSHKEALLYDIPAQTYDYSGNPELLKGMNFTKSLHNLENSVKVTNPHIFTNDFRIPSKHYKTIENFKKNIKPSGPVEIDFNNLLNPKASKKDLYVSPMRDLFDIPS